MLACVILLSSSITAYAQPAAGAYDAMKPDLRGRWAGVITQPTGIYGDALNNVISTFSFEAEIKDTPGGWTMTLTRAPYDLGVAAQPISATFPIGYATDGWINFTASLPTRSGKMVTLQFRGQANPRWSAPQLIGRGFHGAFVGGTGVNASGMHAARITDAPGIAPIVKGLSGAELARWPVTLAQHGFQNNACASSDDSAPALIGVHGTIAVYASTERRATRSVCVLHDIPASQPIVTLGEFEYGSGKLSSVNRDDLLAAIQNAWSSPWGGGAAAPTDLVVSRYVKNQHLFGIHDPRTEETLITGDLGKGRTLVSVENMLATGSPLYSADSILGARALEGDRNARIAARNAEEKPAVEAAFAEQEAAVAKRKLVAAATRPALAKKHGYINHADAYWAGVDYRPKDGESPGADLRLVFDGNSGAESGSPLANAYLTDYVRVAGERCGKANKWPVIPITTVRTFTTTNGLGTIIAQSTNSTTINYYVDPILYDEFTAAITPATAGRYAPLKAFQLMFSFLRGEPNAISMTAEAHMRATKELGWMVTKEGCGSPSMKQLAINLKLMALNRPSLQDAATGAHGSRTTATLYTENGFTFFGQRRIAKETMMVAPIVSGGKTYTWQDIVKLGASKMERDKAANRAWWHPALFRDDAGASYLFTENRDPESEGDEVIRTYLIKISAADIASWRAVRAKYDMANRADVIRAETELMKLKIVRLMTYTAGSDRVTGDQDYPAFFDAARTRTIQEKRPQTVAEWTAGP